MTNKGSMAIRASLVICLMAALSIISGRLNADTGTCGGQLIALPFDDVSPANVFFCSIAEAFFSGLSNGTTGATFSPGDPVPREQMAAFTTRTLDQSLKRGHTRAALGEWWTNRDVLLRFFTATGFHNPRFLACDGLTVWVSNTEGNTVSRVDIKTGELICTLTGILSPQQIVIVSGRAFIASAQSVGKIYFATISRTTDAAVDIVANVGPNPAGITYDGLSLWTANIGTGPGTGSISRFTIPSPPATTFTTGFSQPRGILFDGANLWVTDAGDSSLKRVDTNTGAVLQTIALSGSVAGHLVFDGTNLWIPCQAALGVPDQVYVVRGVGGLRGTVLAQLTGNGLNGPFTAAFDGERICVTNALAQSISLWNATDLSPIATLNMTNDPNLNPRGVCSDGTTFFVGMRNQLGDSGKIFRF